MAGRRVFGEAFQLIEALCNPGKELADPPIAAIVFIGFSCREYQWFVGRSKAVGTKAHGAREIAGHAGLLRVINNLVEVTVCHFMDTAQMVAPHGL